MYTALDIPTLTALLVTPGHISQNDFDGILSESQKNHTDIRRLMVERGLITDEQLGRLVAEHYDVPFIQLHNDVIDPVVFNLIPQIVAESLGVIVFRRDARGVHVAMINPHDIETRHTIEKRVNEHLVVYLITEEDFHEVFDRYTVGAKDEIIHIVARITDPATTENDRDQLIIELVNTFLEYAYQAHASDIHIEPYERKVLVRFRIDGIMHDIIDFPLTISDALVTRIKILSDLRTDEHRAAQDGKFKFTVHAVTREISVDVRVSILPVIDGENVVMRLLSSEGRQFSLQTLGLSEYNLEKVNRAVHHPHGMILVTGPTGSGKTTTLYAMMKILNHREVHIATIEDPVEYDIDGVSQIQVNNQTNLTFAEGLRSIVRQDPDIIMVGEIRDEETANIAVNAAMTGHLVLSTLHTNDAATTLPRLLDMKVEPFLVASTVNIIIAQRLVRKICEHCRTSYVISPEEEKIIQQDALLHALFTKHGHADIHKLTLYHGVGCDACTHTGFSGRLGIFEVMEIIESLRDAIKERASSDDLNERACKEGMITMMEDGIEKALIGVTTLGEILRVTYERA
jgi:type IV pilus assembly protein PilB